MTKTSKAAYAKNAQFNGSNESILLLVSTLQPISVFALVRHLDAVEPLPEFQGRRRERRIIGGMSTLKKDGVIRSNGVEVNPETGSEVESFEINPDKPVPRLSKLEQAREEILRLRQEMVELIEQNEFLIARNQRLSEQIEANKKEGAL